MTTRALRASDIPALTAMAEASGFPVVKLDAPTVEAVCVVTNDNDEPIMAAAAERIVQLFLIAPKGGDPAAKLHAIRLLHDGLQRQLEQRGYTEANVFLPPKIARSFGRRLERTFGWRPNWPSWFLRF